MIINGFLPIYTLWIFHGEDPLSEDENKGESVSSDGDEINEMIYDAFGIPFSSRGNVVGDDKAFDNSEQGFDEKTEKNLKLLKEGERELYPECQKFSTLSFIV